MKMLLEHENIIKKLFGHADFGELYQEDMKIHYIECESGKIEKCFIINDYGFSIRTFLNGNISFSSTNYKSPNEMLNLHIKNMEDNQNNIFLTKKEFLRKENIQDFIFENKIKSIQKLYEDIKIKLPDLVNAKLILQYYVKEFSVSNTMGNFVHSSVYGERFSVHITCLINGEKFTVYESDGKSYSNVTDMQMINVVNKAVERMKIMYNAKPCPAGMMSCVLSSEAGGTLIHEAVGHGLEADLIDKGISIYRDKLGEKVASDLITVVDDSTFENGWGTFLCDDEGIPAQRTVLIEKGVLKNYMYDQFYALKHKKTSTGNGRRQSYSHRPFPRMTNTLILPGESNPDDIFKSVKKGVLVKKMGGGQVNTLTGDFVFDIQEGYLIEDGEIIHPIKQASIIGNGPKVLSEIEAVGSDFGTSLGTCGKEGQGVPVGDGQPTILIPSITIGGTSF